MMIPGIVTIVPKFLILKELHLVNTYGALTIPFMADAFGIFLMKQFFESIPVELEEAARVDGASRYRMFWQIILPNAMPALTALAIFSFQGSWNAFLEPLIFISNQSLFTLPLGLAYFQKANYTEWPILMAMAVITTVPMAIFYLVFQRWFVEGQVTAGIKGIGRSLRTESPFCLRLGFFDPPLVRRRQRIDDLYSQSIKHQPVGRWRRAGRGERETPVRPVRCKRSTPGRARLQGNRAGGASKRQHRRQTDRLDRRVLEERDDRKRHQARHGERDQENQPDRDQYGPVAV